MPIRLSVGLLAKGHPLCPMPLPLPRSEICPRSDGIWMSCERLGGMFRHYFVTGGPLVDMRHAANGSSHGSTLSSTTSAVGGPRINNSPPISTVPYSIPHSGSSAVRRLEFIRHRLLGHPPESERLHPRGPLTWSGSSSSMIPFKWPPDERCPAGVRRLALPFSMPNADSSSARPCGGDNCPMRVEAACSMQKCRMQTAGRSKSTRARMRMHMHMHEIAIAVDSSSSLQSHRSTDVLRCGRMAGSRHHTAPYRLVVTRVSSSWSCRQQCQIANPAPHREFVWPHRSPPSAERGYEGSRSHLDRRPDAQRQVAEMQIQHNVPDDGTGRSFPRGSGPLHMHHVSTSPCRLLPVMSPRPPDAVAVSDRGGRLASVGNPTQVRRRDQPPTV